jgi:cell division protein FtsQ
VREALESTGLQMSTLRVDEKALHRAVEPFSSVAGLRIRTDFPHDLIVEVVEHEPVATVKTGGSSLPATGGGLLLDGVRAEDLPTVTTKAPLDGRHVTDDRTLAALRVAAAAPAELRARADRLTFGRGGLTLELSNGPDLIFGSGGDAESKWRAAARVLADESSGGATYLDLRVPKLVAAGGVGPIEPEPTPDPAAITSNPQP